jgi:hypothetical protein
VTNGETPPEISTSIELPVSGSSEKAETKSKRKRKRNKQKALDTVPYIT